MTKDYIKVKKVSERLFNNPMRVRRTSKKFKALIDECNDIVEQIISKSELSEEQTKQAKKIGL